MPLTFDSSNLRFPVSEAAAGGLMSGTSRLTEEDYLELLKPLAKELAAMARWVS